jgi:hypothetical protein
MISYARIVVVGGVKLTSSSYARTTVWLRHLVGCHTRASSYSVWTPIVYNIRVLSSTALAVTLSLFDITALMATAMRTTTRICAGERQRRDNIRTVDASKIEARRSTDEAGNLGNAPNLGDVGRVVFAQD